MGDDSNNKQKYRSSKTKPTTKIVIDQFQMY